MPGAELTDVVDDRNWKGTVHAKFGPVSMSFAGTVTIQERDDAAHQVVLKAKGMEQKGKGAADASVTSWLEPAEEPGSTTVKMQADITLTGAAAQMSRGLLPEISKKLTQQFADCLQAGMAGRGRAGGSCHAALRVPTLRPRDPPPRPPPSRSAGSASGCPRSGRRSWGSSGDSSAGARRPDRRQPAACAFIRSSSFLVVRRFLIVSSP